MYYPVPTDVLRLGCFCHAANQLGINNHHYVVLSVTGLGATLREIAEEREGTLGTLYQNLIADQATWLGVKLSVPYGVPLPAPEVVNDPSPGNAGTQLLPTQTCGVITWKTDFAGRSNRGRSYIPFPCEGDSDAEDLPSTAYISKLVALGLAIRGQTTITGEDGETVIEHVLRRGPPPGTRIITGQRNNVRWGTQRRRGQYGKVNPAIIS